MKFPLIIIRIIVPLVPEVSYNYFLLPVVQKVHGRST
jgi:hypothetical protein